MKVDQSYFVSLGAVLRREVVRSAHEVDRGEGKKKLGSEPQQEVGPSIVESRSKPIVLDNTQVRLRFDQDKDTGVRIIQVVDADSGKLVRQIPPEELLNITKALRDIKGFIVSKES